MSINAERIVEVIGQSLGCPFGAVGDTYHFDFDVHSLTPLSRDLIEQIASSLSTCDAAPDISLTLDDSYEVLVETGRVLNPRVLREGLVLADAQSNLKYELGMPSDPYLVFLLLKAEETEPNGARRWIRIPPRMIMERQRPEAGMSPLDALRIMSRARTLRIVSPTSQPKSSWKKRVDSFLFHVGYNLDASIVPQQDIDELIRPSRISRLRRSTWQQLDAPRREYISDLVYHYQLGISAESPMLEYISYYHVVEHWFESIYQDDLVEQIQTLVTSPAFSYRRKKDIRDLIKKVTKAVQVKEEDVVINEQVALKLTIERHVDVEQLVDDLDHFDASLVDYYSRNIVGFSGGDIVPLRSENKVDVVAALTRRVYKTRNALVHSKDGSKSRFVPFTDDQQLLPEIPLMRFVAEQVITSTSTLMS